MRGSSTFIPILIWFVAGLALLVVFALIENPFIATLFMPPAALIYGGVAVLLLIGYVRSAIKDRSKRAWTKAASIPLLIAVLIFAAPLVRRAVIYAQFAIMLPAYSRVVETESRSPSKGVVEDGKVTYVVDNGPPVRIAFPKFGIIDNWVAIVYDPSDAVAEARGWDFQSGKQLFTAPPKIKSLFGGDLVECWRLYSHYYSCSFT
jgi:hypothetical protein